MPARRVLVTGASGLVGSEVVGHWAEAGCPVTGIDNNMRADFFGQDGDTTWNRRRLEREHRQYRHLDLDIRDRSSLFAAVAEASPDIVVHAAAQPSHDLAAQRPIDDFEVNALGTLNMLEAVRLARPDAVFVYMSTNKVYGDAPNEMPLVELETRWDYADAADRAGVTEQTRIDRSLHSLFGASKASGDLLVQEYGRYFNMATCSLRGGCFTGAAHSGVELHGFLSYLVKTNLAGGVYRVYGYEGKQVRDNLHAFDVANLIDCIAASPVRGEAFNIGGGRENSCSILEAFDLVEAVTGRPMKWEYESTPRVGDHICYITDLTKVMARYPSWEVTRSLSDIIEEIVRGWHDRGFGGDPDLSAR